MAARIVAALTEIARAPRATDEATLVVSHSGTIRTFIHEVTGAPPPLDNGALFLARYAGDRFVSVTRATMRLSRASASSPTPTACCGPRRSPPCAASTASSTPATSARPS